MSEPFPRATARPSLEQLRKQAKDLLRQCRSGDSGALARVSAASPRFREDAALKPQLADIQFVIAREQGFPSWSAMKRCIEDVWPSRLAFYERMAADLVAVSNEEDSDALQRLNHLFGGTFTAAQARERIAQRLSAAAGEIHTAAPLSMNEARRFVAALYGFANWDDFEASVSQPPGGDDLVNDSFTASPPFYRIDRKENRIEPRPPLRERDWDEILEVMRARRIRGLRAAGQVADGTLAKLAKMEHLRTLDLEGCRSVTDRGLRHLAGAPWIENLNLTGCSIGDDGLRVLRQLRNLREFSLYHHSGVSDVGLAHLSECPQLERVSLLGSHAGDGVIAALAGKTKLKHLKSGQLVTDAGVALLREIPMFRSWHGGVPEYSLMGFEAGPTYLLLRGALTDEGMKQLAALDGVFALNVDDSKLAITTAGLRHLGTMANLGWLGFDASDETMEAIAAMPRLRFLMCQDTRATDAGFLALSASRSMEYLWGRRCYGLTGVGFRALSRMPALRGLSVSCRNVDDTALSALPAFPALDEFMPMDVPDVGFRHVGACDRLEALWCMYCRETGDAATEHIARLPRLKTYYAGQTGITDRSMELLSGIRTLERITLWSCAGVTNAGVAMLAGLENLHELSIESMPRITREIHTRFHANVQVTLSL